MFSRKILTVRAISVFILLIPNFFSAEKSYSQQFVVTNPASPWTVPPGVSSIKVEVWGGGGAGGGSNGNAAPNLGGSGGGGGAYNAATFTVAPGQTYTITIGTGGQAGVDADGGNGIATTVEGTGGAVTANAGTGGGRSGGQAGVGGTGGLYSGGNGGLSILYGAGGGGGAGNAGNGGDGSDTNAGTGGVGNPNFAPYTGGNGGAVITKKGDGNAGNSPGGGGGGGRVSKPNATSSGGAGASGQVVITYTIVQPATKLAFVSFPASGNINTDFTSFTVEALGPNDIVDNLYTGDITLTKVSGPGTLSGTLTVAAVNGVATFSNVQVNLSGNYTLNASSGSLTGATSSTIVISGDYRSNGSGNWSTGSTWQTFNGSSWVPASTGPTSASGNITILNGHTITVNSNVTADQVTIDTGGSIDFNAGISLTIADGPGTDLTNNGTITVSAYPPGTGTLNINGQMQNNSSVVTQNRNSRYGTVNINNSATLTCSSTSVVSGTGDFNLLSGATIEIGSPAGISALGTNTGNIQTTNIRNFSTNANYIYRGTGSQVTGNGLPLSAITGNITIESGASVTNTSAVNINGTLSILAGGTLTPGPGGLITAANVTNSGVLTINPPARATISSLTNNGILNLNSASSSDIFSLIVNNYSGSGTSNIQLFLTGGGSPDYNWHYVAVPQDGLPATFFTSIDPYNLMAYNDSRVTTSEFNGWSWHDGYGGTPGIASGGGFTTLSYGHGYNFYHSSDATVNFTGITSLGTTLGTAGIVSLQYSGSTPGSTIYGYNLLGNSLTCSLDWNLVTFNGSVGSAVYYTTGNKWATFIQGGGGVNGATKDIPPLQGFFVKADATGGSVNFSAAREHSSQVRYKRSITGEQVSAAEEIVYPKVKLELNGTSTSDETIVWFNNEATTGYDERYDAFKFFSSESTFSQLYSTIGGKNYVINGIPLPADSEIVPLGIKIAQTGNFTLIRNDLVLPDGYDMLLIDKANNNFTVNLKNTGSYSFSSDAGTFTNRFILKITALTTRVENPVLTSNAFNIYSFNGTINIVPGNIPADGLKGGIRVFDLTGRVVKDLRNVILNEGTPILIPCNDQHGIYMVEVTSGGIRHVAKVFLP